MVEVGTEAHSLIDVKFIDETNFEKVPPKLQSRALTVTAGIRAGIAAFSIIGFGVLPCSPPGTLLQPVG